MALTPGTTLGPYRIVGPLGAGGMGEVYKATDTRLGRTVAIKVLPAEVSEDPEALARFEREAKAIAALSHPNILAIHDVGRDHGVSYSVTELLEGDTLRARLAVGALPPRKAVGYATQLAEALAAAHERGIVHRDVKPENVFIQRDGRVKLLDFGLARTDEEDELQADDETRLGATAPHTVVGTIGYMSPEQVRGERADARSDVFAFGTVLYELLSGRRAFAGPSAAEVQSAVLRDDPPALAQSGSRVPPRLERILRRCLEKGPGERFQSARDLAFALSDALDEVDTLGEAAAYPPPEVTPRAARQATSSTAALPCPVSAQSPAGAGPSMAVLPFANMSADPEQEYFCDGLAEELIHALARLQGLRVVARASAFQFKSASPDLREVSRQLEVKSVLTGSVRKTGTRLRVNAQLINADDGCHLWAERYDRELDDVFAVQEDIARSVVRTLEVTLLGTAHEPLVKQQTRSTEAYDLYLRGHHYWNQYSEDNLNQAVECFNRAIEQDPSYGQAHAELALCHLLLAFGGYVAPSDAYPKVRAAATDALDIDADLAEAHTALGAASFYYDWDWKEAEQHYRHAVRLNPRYVTGRVFYSFYLVALGRPSEGFAQLEMAQQADPLSVSTSFYIGDMLFYTRQYDNAVEHLEATLAIDPAYPPAVWFLGLAYQHQGAHGSAIKQLEKAVALTGRDPLFLAQLAHAYGVAGQPATARRLLNELQGMTTRRYLSPWNVALVYIGLGEIDQALEWLEKAFEERSGWMPWLNTDPRLDPLRPDPRFEDLLRRLNFPRAPSPVVPSSDDPALEAPAGHATVGRARAEAEPSRGVAGGSRPETSQASIAVLPFADMSPQKDQGYFCEGIAEEILNAVARVKGLRVAARTSSFQAKAKGLGIAEIGARLKVGTVLEGSVRTAGERVRVAAQLVSVSDGYQIWSERYDRRLEDVFDIQDDIARAIARALKGTLTAGEDASLSERQPRNLDAYTLYLKGRFFWNKRNASSLRQALHLFQEAVQLDPEYGPAHSGLADTYNLLGVLWVMPPVEAHPLARAAAQRALVLDETLAEAHTSLAFVYSAFDWNWGAAQREFQRAIELSPDYPSTRHFYAAYCLAPMGRLDEAVTEMRRAQSLDPLAPILGADTGCLLHWAQRDDEAIAQHLHTIEQFPDFALTYYYLAHAYVQKGLHDEAITAARKALSIAGDAALFVAGLGYALAASGRATEARQTLDGLIARKHTEPVPAYHLALICTGLGDTDDAFAWLEQAYHERSWLPWLRVEGGFAPLRSDARFADLVRRMHLPDE